nr:MAG TPA: BAH domain protein [Caudoviricetes sp.]
MFCGAGPLGKTLERNAYRHSSFLLVHKLLSRLITST